MWNWNCDFTFWIFSLWLVFVTTKLKSEDEEKEKVLSQSWKQKLIKQYSRPTIKCVLCKTQVATPVITFYLTWRRVCWVRRLPFKSLKIDLVLSVLCLTISNSAPSSGFTAIFGIPISNTILIREQIKCLWSVSSVSSTRR